MTAAIRDHTLDGPEAARAAAGGLVGAQWYRTPLDRRTRKDLTRREDGPGIRDAALRRSLLAASGAGVLNSRTILMGPVLRFFPSNVNRHAGHHMVPMAPRHRLPDLRRAIAHDCPAPCPSVRAAWAEIIPAVPRQRRDPGHVARRVPPPGAGRAPVPA